MMKPKFSCKIYYPELNGRSGLEPWVFIFPTNIPYELGSSLEPLRVSQPNDSIAQ